jgi:predicted amidophosphoribosyltransferase
MFGIIAGVAVMIFSFGPMIVLLFLRPRLREEKSKIGQTCETCGYDLRASTDRCPECGTPFTRAAEAAQNLDPDRMS